MPWDAFASMISTFDLQLLCVWHVMPFLTPRVVVWEKMAAPTTEIEVVAPKKPNGKIVYFV